MHTDGRCRGRVHRARAFVRRGEITLLDRKAMERTAGDAYGTPEAEYRRLIG
jgi:hypothetical protein